MRTTKETRIRRAVHGLHPMAPACDQAFPCTRSIDCDRARMPSRIQITVRCFAAVRDLFGRDQIDVELDEGSVLADLRTVLLAQQPKLAALPLAYAVNRAYAKEDRVLQQGDEVALIPPISGGSPDADVWRLDFQREPLDARELERQARTDRDGAVCTFTGTTRNHNEGALVKQLAYEAFEEMAQEVTARIVADVFAQHAITRVRIAHRLGPVPVGEACVVVVVSAEHRGPAFDACRVVMDRLKHEVPIWKRELLRDGGGERWVGELPKVDPLR